MITRALLYIIISVVGLITACGTKTPHVDTSMFNHQRYQNRYATGFQVKALPDSLATLLLVAQSTANSVDSVVIVHGDRISIEAFGGVVIRGEAKRIITLDEALIAMFDSLDVAERIVGVASMEPITNRVVRESYERGRLLEVCGDGQNLDFDAIVALHPDILFLDASANRDADIKRRLNTLRIPYIYIDDSHETSSLAKREWVVALAQLVGRDDVARRYFASTKARYDTIMKHTIELLHLEEFINVAE